MSAVQETPIFSNAFTAMDPAQIVEKIRADGFFSMERAIAPEFIDHLLSAVEKNRFAVNRNWITGVFAESQYYLTHMLACSRAFFDYVTHPKCFAICDLLLGAHYRLKAMRYYETYGGHHMQWHTDNKTDKEFAHIPGLIFIFYLADVNEGEFQYVRGSQHFSGTKSYNDYSDEFIEKNYAKDIISFKGPKGTMLIYDTYGIHRAKPVADATFVRKSLFFQVDADCNSAEPILLNPAYIHKMDDKIAKFLGFGLPAEYKVFPDTSLKSLPVSRISIRNICYWITYRTARGLYDFLPYSTQRLLRAQLKKIKSN